MPKLSIVIPTYNQTEYLKKVLDSISEQSFNDYELIVSDDSSNGEVKMLLDSYSQLHDKLRYFLNKPALGSPENWNEAIRHANGDYVKIIHHDDWLSNSSSLAEYVALLDENPEVDFAFSATDNLLADGKLLRKSFPTNEQLNTILKTPEELLLGNLIGPPSAIIFRREIFQPFNQDFIWVVDIDWYIRMMHASRKVGYTDTALLSNISLRPGSITIDCYNNPAIEVKEFFSAYNIHSKNIQSDKDLLERTVKMLNELLLKYKIASKTELEKYVKGEIPDLPLNYYTKPKEVSTVRLLARKAKRFLKSLLQQ